MAQPSAGHSLAVAVLAEESRSLGLGLHNAQVFQSDSPDFRKAKSCDVRERADVSRRALAETDQWKLVFGTADSTVAGAAT